jgi:hypothetical protein
VIRVGQVTYCNHSYKRHEFWMEEINQENIISSFGGLYMNYVLYLPCNSIWSTSTTNVVLPFSNIYGYFGKKIFLKNYASSILDYFNS